MGVRSNGREEKKNQRNLSRPTSVSSFADEWHRNVYEFICHRRHEKLFYFICVFVSRKCMKYIDFDEVD